MHVRTTSSNSDTCTPSCQIWLANFKAKKVHGSIMMEIDALKVKTEKLSVTNLS